MFRGGATSSGNAAISSGTIGSAVTGPKMVLGNVGIPFIHISSGSIAANGALTGITALQTAYPRAYIYLPANAVATVAAAGWYYATFSTTTAGVVFLDTYTSGQPTVPASPTAVTDGKGAYTGVITEVLGPNYTLPALSANGRVEYFFSQTNNNSAGAKAIRIRVSGLAGTMFGEVAATTGQYTAIIGAIQATGKTNEQRSDHLPNVSMSTQRAVGTVDLSTGTAVFAVGLIKATATDSHELLSFSLNLASNAT